MGQYLVIKNAALQVGDKVYRKDMLMSSDEVDADNIARLMGKGYIKPLKSTSDMPEEDVPDLPFTDDYRNDFRTVEELNKMSKAQLTAYAREIGVTGFKSNDNAGKLRELINNFIEDSLSEFELDEDEDEKDGDIDDGDETNDDSDERKPPEQLPL